MVTIRDNGDEIKILLSSNYTAIADLRYRVNYTTTIQYNKPQV